MQIVSIGNKSMNFQILFPGKNKKKYFKLSSAIIFSQCQVLKSHTMTKTSCKIKQPLFIRIRILTSCFTATNPGKAHNFVELGHCKAKK